MIIPEILKQLTKNHGWHLFNTTHSHCDERYDIRLPGVSAGGLAGDIFCAVTITEENVTILEMPSLEMPSWTETNINLADPNSIHKIKIAVTLAHNRYS